MAIKQDILKKRKKKWYSILASKEFRNAVIGESYVDDINLLKGRTIKANLMSITNDFKKQNVNAIFFVDEIKGDHACAKLIAYEVIPSYIKRLSKKAKTKIEDSFKIESMDKIKIVVKPLVIVKAKINKSTSTVIRQKIKEHIISFLSKKNYEDFVKAVIFESLQKELRDKLNKISPVGVCLIRVFKIINK